MGLFGSLFTGVSALFAQSQNTAIISNNIANVNTTGYKRSEASFNSLVTTQSGSSQFSPGTASVSRQQRVDQQGAIQQTASSTDAAVSGNGFFPVRRSTQAGQEFLYTRAGSFSEDASGILRNASGFILYAWPIDTNGNLPANQGDLTSLVPADVAFLGGLTRPTTSADLAINLDADQAEYNRETLNGGNLPIPTANQAHFSRGLTVFDSLGSPQTLTLEFRKIEGPQAHVTSTEATAVTRSTALLGAAPFANVLATDRFSLTTGAGTTREYDFGSGVGDVSVTTMGGLIDDINANFTGELEARLDSSGTLFITHVGIDSGAALDQFTVAETNGTPLTGGAGTLQIPTGVIAPQDFRNVAGPYPGAAGQSGFPTLADEVSPNTQGWWELTVIAPSGTSLQQGLVNFSGDGTLNANADANGVTGINITDINFGNGSDPTQDINIDISRFSQFAGNFDVIFSDQNGAELGLRTGIELTREGRVVARFSNGASADLYQAPLVTFANANGLTEVSGTAYSENESSGEENLREAGAGGAGFVEPSTLESSNVDLADEFARLIVAQRAFGAATRTINTVDQMTQDLLSLRG